MPGRWGRMQMGLDGFDQTLARVYIFKPVRLRLVHLRAHDFQGFQSDFNLIRNCWNPSSADPTFQPNGLETLSGNVGQIWHFSLKRVRLNRVFSFTFLCFFAFPATLEMHAMQLQTLVVWMEELGFISRDDMLLRVWDDNRTTEHCRVRNYYSMISKRALTSCSLHWEKLILGASVLLLAVTVWSSGISGRYFPADEMYSPKRIRPVTDGGVRMSISFLTGVHALSFFPVAALPSSYFNTSCV